MKFIKYTKIEKTKDRFKPVLHEAQFKSNNEIITASYNGSQIIFKDDLRPKTKDEVDITTKLIHDWNVKEKLLKKTRANFIAMGIDPKDYVKD